MDRKTDYKRSRVCYKAGKGVIDIRVTASDSVALLASINSAVKQLRVITSVDSAITKLAAKPGGV